MGDSKARIQGRQGLSNQIASSYMRIMSKVKQPVLYSRGEIENKASGD